MLRRVPLYFHEKYNRSVSPIIKIKRAKSVIIYRNFFFVVVVFPLLLLEEKQCLLLPTM